MKLFKVFFGLITLVTILFSLSTPFSGCTKQIVHDTTTIKDTLTITDTIRITDTVGCYNLKDGLVAYYNFTGGNLNDSSGYHNNIIFNNATSTTDRFGKPNNAYLFDGVSSYMRVMNSASLNPDSITLMAVVKFNDFYRGACSGNSILMKGPRDETNGVYTMRVQPEDGGCDIPVDTTKEIFTSFYGDYGYTSDALATASEDFIKPGVWYTVIYTYDGTHSKLYVNGVLKEDHVKTAVFNANTNDVFIGLTENPSAPYGFNGVIDEVRIYKKALCASAVQQLSCLKQ